MEQVDIQLNGTTILSTPINEGSKRKFLMMSDDYITLEFSLATPVFFALGSKADNELGWFEVVDEQNPTFNEETGGWDYTLKMEAYYMKWKNKKFKFAPDYSSAETSWNLTATLSVHMDLFIKNLNVLGYTYRGQEFTYEIDSTVTTEAKLISYSNMNMIDALNEMVSEDNFDCEWWVTDNVIHFGRCEYGTAVEFSLEENLVSMTSSESKSTYATRVYAFGSTRNIPDDYRDDDTDTTTYGVYEKRLRLPKGVDCIDAEEGLSQEAAVEDTVIFEDVYPRTDGTIEEITTYDSTVENDDGTKTTVTYYRFKDSGITFSKDYILDTEELQMIFQSGKLNGMTFGVNFNPKGVAEKKNGEWNPEAQLFEIVASEDYGRLLPDSILCPEVGDKYILIGWDSTQIYGTGLIDKAEQELLEKAKEYVEKVKIDPNTYDCTLMSDYAYGLNDKGEQDPTCAKTFSLGDRIRLVNSAFFKEGYRDSRIIGFEYNLDFPYDNPIYTVGETATYSRLGEIESDVDELTKQGQTSTGSNGSSVYVVTQNDTTNPTDRNVFSSLRSRKEFLRKDQDDTSNGKLTFNKGFQTKDDATFGDFAGGMTGFGGKIDAKGNGELHSLSVRTTFDVPEIRYNRATAVVGISWQTSGAGIIETVTPDTDEDGNVLTTGTATLKLEDGEIGTIAVDDICQGVWHNIKGGNSEETTDDGKGNFTFAGFSTVYFRIDEILDSENKTFRYSLRPISDTWKSQHQPSESMNFACYGNFTDKTRQSSYYETTTYRRQLSDVNTWEFSEANIQQQDGDLSNLSVFGLNMTGWSTYTRNLYVAGTINQISTTPLRLELSTDGDYFLTYGESIHVTCTAMQGYQDKTSEVTSWKVTRDTSDSAADTAWALRDKVKNFNGEIDLCLDSDPTVNDLGENDNVRRVIFTFTCTIDNEEVETTLEI